MKGFTPMVRSIGISTLGTARTTAPTAPHSIRFQLRNLHPSSLTRRAPVPHSSGPRTGRGFSSTSTSSGPSSTISSGSVNGSRAGGSGAGTGTGNGSGPKKPSPHAMWYREIVPAMIPPLLLSLTIFLSLSLFRLHLSHQLSISEQQTRIDMLEQELERLRNQAVRRAERERRERERMLPVVVGKVLQRVGVLNREMDEEEEERVAAAAGIKEGERLLV